MRRGFTLIETIVALVLLEIGMLALAAFSAVAARELAVVHRSIRAQSLARNRVEHLSAMACSNAASGETIAGGFIERWDVGISGDRRAIRVTVEFAVPPGSVRRIAMSTAAICR
jgi:Tfp pilus assembly protein PilV